jgi:HSP20 family protein
MEQELKVQQKREVENSRESTIPARSFIPPTDVFENEQSLIVVMEVPGIQRDQVDVRVENNVLTVEGRLDQSKYNGLQPVYTEYNIGNYARSFQLSSQIDQNGIKAELTDGVMTLTLPKAETAKARRIKINQ